MADLIVDRLRRGLSLDEAVDDLRSGLGLDEELLAAGQQLVQDILGTVVCFVPEIATDTVAPWFARKDSDRYWPATKAALAARLPGSAVDEIDGTSVQIINHSPPPRGPASFATRGLVLGRVQSGKTGNFTGLIATAADAGYQLVVVLTGLYENLRYQTQARLDWELVDACPGGWHRLTTTGTDFPSDFGNQAALLGPFWEGRSLAVVKKNIARLRYLNDWLDAAGPWAANVPIFVVDDEADQASLNYHSDPNLRTGINEQIVRLVTRNKVAYVGYTATPFANILGPDATDEDDLYPRDFIISLGAGDGYCGPERLFGRAALNPDEDPVDGCDMIRYVPPDDGTELAPPVSTPDLLAWSPSCPESLGEAVLYFVLATAARRERGHTGPRDHSTMLVHLSHRVLAHEAAADLLRGEITSLRRAWAADGSDLKDRARALWATESTALQGSGDCDQPDQAEPFPPDATISEVLDELTVFIEHGASESRLDYDSADRPLVALVVGGNVLSRGLTLEGLVVSFFLRSSGQYDTLLQMGRWFGYRTGYGDLPRIWMPPRLADHFRFFALLEAEMRRDIRRMTEEPSLNPMNLGVRIRRHRSMQITSSLRMRNARTVRSGYSGYRGEAIHYFLERAELEQNIRAAAELVSAAHLHGDEQGGLRSGRHLFTGVPAQTIGRFVRHYRFHPRNVELVNDGLIRYLEEENTHGDLMEWNVGIISQSDAPLGTIRLGDHGAVSLISRSRLPRDPDVANIGVLRSDSDDYRIDLPTDHERATGDPPLLLLYPISRESPAGTDKRIDMNAPEHVIGIAVAFPPSRRHSTVEWTMPQLPTPEGEFEFDDEPTGEE